MDSFEPLSDKEKAASGASGRAKKDEGIAIVPVPGHVSIAIPKHPLGVPAKRWEYRDAQGCLLFIICRFIKANGEKEDRPLTYRKYKNGVLRWGWKSVDSPRPLYGLDRLAARPDAPVLVCEGEKATDAAQILFPDYVVVTSPNGAGSAAQANWNPLRGRLVTIWPDNDEEGKQYAANVAQIITKLNKGK